jgi:hypothetical protein
MFIGVFIVGVFSRVFEGLTIPCSISVFLGVVSVDIGVFGVSPSFPLTAEVTAETIVYLIPISTPYS